MLKCVIVACTVLVSGLMVVVMSSQTPVSVLYHFTVRCLSVRSRVFQTSSGICRVRVIDGSKVAPSGWTR